LVASTFMIHHGIRRVASYILCSPYTGFISSRDAPEAVIAGCPTAEFRVEGDDCPLAAATHEAGVADDDGPVKAR
jgi:hypothetical protein